MGCSFHQPHLGPDTNELALTLEERDPLAQVARRGHRPSVYGDYASGLFERLSIAYEAAA